MPRNMGIYCRRSGQLFFLLLAVAATLFTTATVRAEAFPGSVVQVGPWRVQAHTRGRTPDFDGCIILRAQSEGFTFFMRLRPGGSRDIAAEAPAWGLTPNESYPSTFTVGASTFTFNGRATSRRGLSFGAAPEFFAELKSGRQLSVSANQRFFAMTLDGIEAAMARQQECVKEYTGRTLALAPARQSAPPSIPPPVPITALVILSPPKATYPASSKQAGEQGEVLVDAVVDVKGLPSTIILQRSSGHPALDDSAIDAVRGMRFRPYVENGNPRPVTVRIPILFRLQ